MDPQYHAEFLQKIGHRIRESRGVLWFDIFSRAYTTIPYDAPVDSQSFAPADVLGADGVMARYSCDVQTGVNSFQHVVTDKNYGLCTLDRKARNKTRQGLRNCRAAEIDPRDLGAAGIQLHADTLLRQGRRLPDDFESYWKKYFAAAADCPAATAWAAWHENELAAYLISFRAGPKEYISIVRSSQEKLPFRPNNAMLYTFLETVLKRPEISEVSIGLQSLQPGGESLDQFKRGMGFQERPIGQRIELRPGFSATLPRPVAALAARTLRYLPGGEKQARLSGALQWYASQPRIRRAA
ncbi:MAG: hypothetical protein RIK87_28435 [Fuerstiella sp.]